MRIFFLVLLLILNVYAEAKSSGSARSRSLTKKEKTTVVAKKSTPKSVDKSKTATKNPVVSSSSSEQVPSSSSTSVFTSPISTTSVATTSEVADNSEKNAVVRDTVVDTVYVVMPESAKPVRKEECNVPLPHQSAFLGEGLSVGVGAGLFNASKDCDCLGVWQGQLEYHYKDFITGGLDVRFFGGTLDSDVMLMYQRYRLNVRFHRGFTGADFYISPLFGLETTDLSEFRKELRDGSSKNGALADASDVGVPGLDGSDSLQIEKNCEKMFSLDGFTFGIEAGMGLVVFRYLGLSASASYEFNLSWTQLAAFSPGVAFNLREVWPWAGQNLRSTWISFEMVFQRYFNRSVKEWAVAGFLGLQFGI